MKKIFLGLVGILILSGCSPVEKKDLQPQEVKNEVIEEVDVSIDSQLESELQSIQDKSIYQTEIRDEKGAPYEIYIFSEDGSHQIASMDKGTVWAGAREGDTLYTGTLQIAYKGADDTSLQYLTLGEETLNLSYNLINTHVNPFDAKSDLVSIGTVEASSGTYIRSYHILGGQLQPVKVKSGEELVESLSTLGTDPPFFKQVDANTFETAYYDNTETGHYFIEEWVRDANHILHKMGDEVELTRDDFFAYRDGTLSSKHEVAIKDNIGTPEYTEEIDRASLSKPEALLGHWKASPTYKAGWLDSSGNECIEEYKTDEELFFSENNVTSKHHGIVTTYNYTLNYDMDNMIGLDMPSYADQIVFEFKPDKKSVTMVTVSHSPYTITSTDFTYIDDKMYYEFE